MAKTKKNENTPAPPPKLFGELKDKVKEHRLPIFAAGVAFFAFIALIPALAAAVSITGMVADTETLKTETEAALANSPEATRDFVVQQITDIADSGSTGAGIAAAIGIAASVFTASGAVGQLMETLNVVFDRTETRNFILKRLLAIGLMLGALVMVAAMVFTMSVLPAQLNNWIDSSAIRWLISIGRFVALGLLMVAALSFLYRVGPASDPARSSELVAGGKSPIITKGAAVGTALIVLLSWGFGVFVNNFGSYGETYGTLATIIVVMLWLQLMALAVLIGAEVDAALGRQRVYEARQSAGLDAVTPTAS